MVLRPCSASTAATSAAADCSPESTTEVGELIAAIDSSASLPAIAPASSASVASIATIAPPSGRAPISLPLAATSLAASARERTPARWAALISPIEWPASRSGFNPMPSSSRYRATSVAKRAGWA